ncbi:MAG TPA: protein kinase, partial [Candidatus Thermoplasmatota archaeon]|nr:protein kinase [Candidatus Thermoplasmatota archaeon]
MALSANSVPLLLFTVVSFALAALLLRLNYHHRASRVFAFLLIVRGMGFTYQVGLLVGQPDADYWWRLYPYTAMLTTIVASYFAALHPRPLPGMRSRWAPVPFIAGALVLEVLYLADHRLYWDLGQLSSDTFGPLFGAPIGPLFLFAEAYRIPFAVVALRCAMAWAAAPSRRERATHLMVSFGFIVVVALDAPVGFTSFYTTGRPWLVSVQPAISLALVLLTLVYVAVQAVREPAPDRRGVAWYVALVPFALASTVLFVALPDPPRGTVIIATSAFWRLVLPALTVYALLRHHLFDLDLRVKRTVRRSSVAAAFVALYLVGSQVAARLLPEAWGPLVGLSFAGLLLLGFAPLQRAAERFADAVFPGVSPSEAYLQPRRIEAYRSALEDTLARGAPSAEDVGRLARLRRELGLSERDHEVLLQAVAGRDLLESRLPTGTEVLGRYRVLRQLGEGGSGRAYLAKDLARGDLVVVKTLQGTGQEHGLREARAVQALHHPNVVALRDVRREAGHTLLVMDHLEGGSLRDRLERKVLGGSEYRRVASDLLRALEAVHAAGIVHR